MYTQGSGVEDVKTIYAPCVSHVLLFVRASGGPLRSMNKLLILRHMLCMGRGKALARWPGSGAPQLPCSCVAAEVHVHCS